MYKKPLFIGFIVFGLVLTFMSFQNSHVQSVDLFQAAQEDVYKVRCDVGDIQPRFVKYPDPNEPIELQQLYMIGYRKLMDGYVEEAVNFFEDMVIRYPESRHAHMGLAESLWHKHAVTQEEEFLRRSMQEYIRAMEIGMIYSRIWYTSRIFQGLGFLGEIDQMDNFFEQTMLSIEVDPYLVQLHYANALRIAGDPRAEEWLQMVIDSRPTGTTEAVSYYAEWLIAQGRFSDTIEVLTLTPTGGYYLHFLRGLAFEKLGQLTLAEEEYAFYRPFNAYFPAPAGLKIEGSKLQESLQFHAVPLMPTQCDYQDPICQIAEIVHAEAESENIGARRAVGWVIRNRVFLGNVGEDEYGNACMTTDNSGETLAEMYQNVMANGFAEPHPDPDVDSQEVAYDVYYGRVPDPYSGYCPNPITKPEGGYCSGYCMWWDGGTPRVGSELVGGSIKGLIAHHAQNYDSSCDMTRPDFDYPPFSCSSYQGYVCDSVGVFGNCFYTASLMRIYLPVVLRSEV